MQDVEDTAALAVMVSNPTVVAARWTLTHVPSVGGAKHKHDLPHSWDSAVDDPTVFALLQDRGVQMGPSLPLKLAAACMPHDQNRLETATIGQTVTALQWEGGTLVPSADTDANLTTLTGFLKEKNDSNWREPRPVEVLFKPKKDVKYLSRFRFNVANGEGFDIVLSGQGSLAEEVARPRPAPLARLQKLIAVQGSYPLACLTIAVEHPSPMPLEISRCAVVRSRCWATSTDFTGGK